MKDKPKKYPGTILQAICPNIPSDGEITYTWWIDDKPIYVVSLTTSLRSYYEIPEDWFEHWNTELRKTFAFAEGKTGIVQLQPVRSNSELYQGKFQPQREIIKWLKSQYDIAYILPAHRNLYMHPEVREHKIGKNPSLESLHIHYDQAATKCGFAYDQEIDLFLPKIRQF
jgi:hypothetical protein